MGGKGSFLILLIIVAFLSLTLAGLAGYVFFFAAPASTTAEASNHAVNKKVTDEELDRYKLFEEKKFFNLKSTDDKKISVIQVGAEIQFYKKVKGIKDVKTKVTAYDAEIKELVGTYFQSLTLEEVKHPEAKEKAREVLTKKINELFGEKEAIVYKIVFDDWFYQ